MLVDIVGQGRRFRVERGLVAFAPAVAVELDVGDVPAMPLEGFHRFQRRLPVAGQAQVVAVDVDRMRQFQCVHRRRRFADDLPRRDTEVIDGFVHRVHVAAGVALPNLDAARIDQLDGVRFGGAQQPGDEALQLFGLPLLNRPHHEMVIAGQDVEALVDTRRIVEFFVGVTRHQGRDRRVKSRGVAQADVLVAGRKGAGDAAQRPAVRMGRPHDGILAAAFLLRAHFARGIDLGAGNMAVHIDPAGHHHQAGGVQRRGGLDVRIAGRRNNFSALNPDDPGLGHPRRSSGS